jgi:hypothetical protein
VAVRSLGRIADPRAIDPLLEFHARVDSDILRRDAVIALGGMSRPEVLPELIQIVESDRVPLNALAAEALATFTKSPAGMDHLRNTPGAIDALVKSAVRLKFYKAEVDEALVVLDREPGGIKGIITRLKGDPELPGDVTAGLDLLSEAKDLDIEFTTRFSRETLREIIENRKNPARDDRPVAALIYCKSDHNGAFHSHDSKVRQLIDNGYRVMYLEAGSDISVARALQSASALGTPQEKRASLIVLAGHGMPEGIAFGPLTSGADAIDRFDKPMLLRERVPDTLEAGGQVVLISCSTGAGMEREPNMANFLREIFPHAAVRGIWAPTRDSNIRNFRFTDRRLSTVEFHIPQEETYQARLPDPQDRLLDRESGVA